MAKSSSGSLFQVCLCFAAVLVQLLIPACGKKAPPLPPVHYELPVVDDLSAQLEGSRLILSWSLPDWEGPAGVDVAGFHVYYAKVALESACESCPVQFKRAGEVAVDDLTAVFDSDLQYTEVLEQGYHYRYKVSAFVHSGREGEDSNIVRINYP